MSATNLKQIKLKFCGLQKSGVVWMALWNVSEDIVVDSKVVASSGSTLAEASLEYYGFFVPNPTGWRKGEEFVPDSVLVS